MFVLLSGKSFTFLKCGAERFFFRNFYNPTVSSFHPLRLSRCLIPSYQPLQHSNSFPPQNHCKSGLFSQRLDFLSTQSDPPKPSTGDVSDNKVSLVQRFKNAYKVYGKVLIVVHGVTSVAWLGLFYLIAYRWVITSTQYERLKKIFPKWVYVIRTSTCVFLVSLFCELLICFLISS